MIRQIDLFDVVAINDGPQLQSYRRRSLDEYKTSQEPEQVESNKMPGELLRRASETATISILDLESENERLLGEKLARQQDEGKMRPQPPPRANNMSSKGQLGTGKGKQQQQQQQLQANNRVAVSLSNNMTENGNPAAAGGVGNPAHTKLDIQKFSEEYNNVAASDAVVAVDETAQNAATIILTPTSLNLTNTTPNAPPGGNNNNNNSNINNNGSNNRTNTTDTGNNGTSFTAHGEHYKGPKCGQHELDLPQDDGTNVAYKLRALQAGICINDGNDHTV
ncbi:hypothetical protein ACLKA7_011212 [Drosophila subpalustris]